MPHPITALQTLSASDFLHTINDPYMKLSFSQFGEDVVVHSLLADSTRNRTGFYVDVGAYHPRMYSNTKAFHMAGWTGINIDANDEAIELFKVERPNDINICCGIMPTEGEAPYYKFAFAPVSTFSKEMADKWVAENGWEIVSSAMKPVRTINNILAEHVPAGRKIDYLNVDIEGMDGSVVNDIDLSRFRPSVISVELHDVDRLRPDRHPTVARLCGQGYELMAVCLVTYIFLDSATPSFYRSFSEADRPSP